MCNTVSVRNSPVGIFDSGVGGLSVTRKIRHLLRAEHLVYFADSGFAPYGAKSTDYITERSIAITEFLLRQGVKAVVVACNTATASSIDTLREKFGIPFIGIEPGIKPASQVSINRSIGILATERTLDSLSLQRLVARFSSSARIHCQPCPGLADLIESGHYEGPEAETLLRSLIEPLLEKKVDTLVLGCTHYAFVQPTIRKIVGADIQVINTATAVAMQLQRRLAGSGLLNPSLEMGTVAMHSSCSTARHRTVMHELWGQPATISQTCI